MKTLSAVGLVALVLALEAGFLLQVAVPASPGRAAAAVPPAAPCSIAAAAR